MISIVMPTFNQSLFIREAIESILAQTYADFELIIVNDGSTDNTLNIITPYLNDGRVRIKNKKNGGTGSALNEGFLVANGEIETWWASDNVMYKNNLEVLIEYLNVNRDVDFVYANCDIHIMDESGLSCIEKKNLCDEVGSQKWDLDKFLRYYFLGICWAWRKELRIRAGGLFQLEPCEDYDMTLRMACVCHGFAHIPKCLGWFRRHKKNMSHKIKGSHLVPYEAINRRKMEVLKSRGLA